MNSLTPFFKNQKFIVLDGAMATELERLGARLNDPLWSAKILLEAPELIRRVHLDYFQAGADVATTASYQATFEGFARKGLDNKASADLMRLSVRLAAQAREIFWSKKENRTGRLRPLIAASVGPYGAYLADGSEYSGDYGLTVEELKNFHRPRMQVLANAGADLLAIETVPCLEEGRALAALLEEFPETPAWLSYSCRDGGLLSHGESIESAIGLANEYPQIVAVGVNCTAPAFIESLLQKAATATEKPLLAYPNSGEVWDADRHCWLPAASENDWQHLARSWIRAGAKLLGGCCRTTPADVGALWELTI